MTKRLIAYIVALGFVTLILPSGNLLAKAEQAAVNSEKKAAAQENRTEKKEEKKNTVQIKMCEKITTAAGKINDKVADLEAKLQSRKEERLRLFENKIADVEKRREEWRKRVDANIEAQLKKMMELAKSENQKDAVTAYGIALKKAIVTRRSAINQAQEAFRLHLREAHNLRKENLNGILSEYRQARKAAFDEAQSQCSSGIEMNQVRTNLKNSLKQAREKFQEQMKNREKVKADLQNYITERNQAIKKAQEDFKATMEQARVELKKASGQVATTVNDATIEQE